MKQKHTYEEVDKYMNENDGSAKAHAFFDTIINWISENKFQLCELHKSFVEETKSEMDFNDFTGFFFMECEDGQKAASILL